MWNEPIRLPLKQGIRPLKPCWLKNPLEDLANKPWLWFDFPRGSKKREHRCAPSEAFWSIFLSAVFSPWELTLWSSGFIDCWCELGYATTDPAATAGGWAQRPEEGTGPGKSPLWPCVALGGRGPTGLRPHSFKAGQVLKQNHRDGFLVTLAKLVLLSEGK